MVDVLNLVPDRDAPPFQKQVTGLEQLDVRMTNVTVPGGNRPDGRGLRHYAKFQLQTLSAARDSYDLVHANYGLTAPMALTQPKRPVVLSLWGSDLMGTYGWLSRRCARHCDAVVVMSEEMAADLDVPCHVIPHGIDLELFEPMDTADAREQLGWDTDGTYVLFPYAQTRPVKDYPRARQVVDAASDDYDGSIELVSVTGVEHERMPLYMNAADVLLLTSRREGSPNVIKEALACNLPVVSTDVGDVRERLADVTPSSVCRTDAELQDSLVSILRHGGRSNGRESVAHLSTEAVSKRLKGVYERVLNGEPSPETAGPPRSARNKH